MASLRPLAVPQDENDVAYGHHRVKFDGSHDGPSFPSGKGFGQRAGGGASVKTPGNGLPSGRKALGNLTNRTGLGRGESGDAPGKTPGGSLKPTRRVLGDITNATPAKQLHSAEAAATPAAKSRAEAYAASGIERRAGKGWQQLEAERLQQDAAAVEKRARSAAMPWPARSFEPQDTHMGRRFLTSGPETVPPSPPATPTSPMHAGHTGDCSQAADCLAELLPVVDAEDLVTDELQSSEGLGRGD